MALHEIVLLGDEVLRTPATEVTHFDDEMGRLIEDMFETMYHAEGIGLAAPQIGISKRIMVVDVPDQEDEPGGRFALLNPRVVAASKATAKAAEGCLSIPGIEEVVERSARVEVHAVTPSGEPIQVEAGGLLSRALQHEIDHLEGVLFLDRIGAVARKMALKRWRKLQEEGSP